MYVKVEGISAGQVSVTWEKSPTGMRHDFFQDTLCVHHCLVPPCTPFQHCPWMQGTYGVSAVPLDKCVYILLWPWVSPWALRPLCKSNTEICLHLNPDLQPALVLHTDANDLYCAYRSPPIATRLKSTSSLVPTCC